MQEIDEPLHKYFVDTDWLFGGPKAPQTDFCITRHFTVYGNESKLSSLYWERKISPTNRRNVAASSLIPCLAFSFAMVKHFSAAILQKGWKHRLSSILLYFAFAN